MSRHGYSDDFDDLWGMIRYRGAVASAIRGRRGQAFLHELRAALDALPAKRLCESAFESGADCCALGAVARSRGIPMPQADYDDHGIASEVAPVFGIANALAAEIMYVNDDAWCYVGGGCTPEQRWRYVSAWLDGVLADEQP